MCLSRNDSLWRWLLHYKAREHHTHTRSQAIPTKGWMDIEMGQQQMRTEKVHLCSLLIVMVLGLVKDWDVSVTPVVVHSIQCGISLLHICIILHLALLDERFPRHRLRSSVNGGNSMECSNAPPSSENLDIVVHNTDNFLLHYMYTIISIILNVWQRKARGQ